MSQPNGLPSPEPQQEAVPYEMVIDYWQRLAMDLHSKLSVSEARMRTRDAVIEQLRSRMALLQNNGGPGPLKAEAAQPHSGE